MKYVLLFMVAGFVVSCGNADKSSSSSQVRDSLNMVAMRDSTKFTTIQWLDSTSQDLGKAEMGQVVEVSWKFRNNGNYPLVISKVTPGCGCTIADKPVEPIAPGKEGLIKASFNSKGQHEGENKKYMTVIANTKPDAVHQLDFHIILNDKK